MKRNDNINLEQGDNYKKMVYCPYVKAPVMMCQGCNIERDYNIEYNRNEYYQNLRNEKFNEPVVVFKAVDIKELQD